MNLIQYNYEDQSQLTPHFKASEWRCKCGRIHPFFVAEALSFLLEKVMKQVGASHGYISSGYRCPYQEKRIGGSGSTTHQGYACDIKFTDFSGKVIESQRIVLALEDLGHVYGIGYKCGGSPLYTHIDVKPRKWYGDESKSMTQSCCDSFYDYFKGQKKETYQVFDLVKMKWLNKIVMNEGKGILAYAGNFGHAIGGLKIDGFTYRVHYLKMNVWSSWMTGSDDYAGNLKEAIDGIQVKNIQYQAHLKNGDWLHLIQKVDDTALGYAGIYGKEIDALKLKK